MKQPLVSIIIPAFNRATLIGDTLESILAQTYRNWECIIVDDGSTDDTAAVVAQFSSRDARISYFNRPSGRPKGANACRNFGFEQSSGDYVIWFDSDDLMMVDKLENQIAAIGQDEKFQFCVSRHDNFDDTNRHPECAQDNNKLYGLTRTNYITGVVFWITIDFLGKRSLFGHQKFNESLQSGQEYHFFAMVLPQNSSGVFLDQTLSIHRVHSGSIQQKLLFDPMGRLQNKFWAYWTTLCDTDRELDREARIFLMRQSAVFYHDLLTHGVEIIPPAEFLSRMRPELGAVKTFALYLLVHISRIVKKGNRPGNALIKKIII